MVNSAHFNSNSDPSSGKPACGKCATKDKLKTSQSKNSTETENEILATLQAFAAPSQSGITEMICQISPPSCEACVQDILNLTEKYSSLRRVEWYRSSSSLSLQFFSGQENPVEVFNYLTALRLQPRWLKPGSQREVQKESRNKLLRLGITGALAANIMMFAIPHYGGLGTELSREVLGEGLFSKDLSFLALFSWVQFFLFLPILFWSAQPFYQGAWASLRARKLSVDLPLMTAFLMGSAASIYALFSGTDNLYFDGLAGFIFLILTARYLVEKNLNKQLSRAQLGDFFERPFVTAKNGELIPLSEIKPGQILFFHKDERLPVDAELLDAACEINQSWISGESFPLLKLSGARIPAGSILVSSKAQVKALTQFENSRFAEMVGELASPREELSTTWEGKLGRNLILFCLGLIAILFLAFPELSSAEFLRRSIAILIVACPCAVAFAAPLARAKALKMAFAMGFWVKRPLVWDQLWQARRFIFDKTGTLTLGRLKVSRHSPLIDNHLKKVILSLENLSDHPIAESLRASFKQTELFMVEDFKEILGQGVQGKINGQFYELKTASSQNDKLVLQLFKNGEPLTEVLLEDEIHPEAQSLIEYLGQRGELFMLSGDSGQRVESFARKLGLKLDQVFGALKPQDKQALSKEIKADVYIGDGANDLLSMKEAAVSIAVQSASTETKAQSDIVLIHSSLLQLKILFRLSKAVRQTMRLNFTFAIAYNVAAASAAFLGMINPLVAAVLMPISSLTLLATTQLGMAYFTKSIQDHSSKLATSEDSEIAVQNASPTPLKKIEPAHLASSSASSSAGLGA